MAASISLLRTCCLATDIVSFFVSRSLPSNGSTHYITPPLRVAVPNSLRDRPLLPSPWFGSPHSYSPTVPVPSPIRPLVPSSCLIRCEPVQVYHRQPRSKVPVDPVDLAPVRSELTAHGSCYIAAERTWTYSKHISRDRYPASLLARRSDLQKTQLPLLLRVGPCLQSCCLATRS
jgi:hypothetical protein